MFKLKSSLLLFLALFFVSCTSRIEIPFTLTEQNRIVIEADVNGTKGKFFWDTGCLISQVNCRTDNLKVAYNGSLAQLSKSDYLTYYTLNSIEIDGKKIKATSEVSRVPEILQKEILDPQKLDGLLGINIFEGYWCELDFNRKKIFLSKTKPQGYTRSIKTELENNYLLLKINIDNVLTKFYIDTGDPYTIKFPESIVHEKKNTGVRKVAFVGDRDLLIVPVNKMIIFDTKFENVYVSANSQFSQTTLSGGVGVIGVNFLKNYNMVFDFRNLRVLKTSDLYYSINNKPQTFLDVLPKISETGILLGDKTKDGLRVQYILKDCPLYKKGIVPDTVITEINKKKIESYSLENLYQILDSFQSIKSITYMQGTKPVTILF